MYWAYFGCIKRRVVSDTLLFRSVPHTTNIHPALTTHTQAKAASY